MRPILRPGCHVLKRGDGRLQVGLDPRHAVVLPDTEPVRGALRLLRNPAERGTPPDPASVEDLSGAGLLVDADALLPHIAVQRRPGGVDRHEVAAVASSLGDDVPQALALRARHRVGVLPFGGEPGRALGDQLIGLAQQAGLSGRPRPRSPRAGTRLAAVVGIGEPHRDLLDDLLRSGTPHVLVRLAEGAASVGPFVVPGRTACLRCLDAHCTDADTEWPLLVQQYAAASSRARPDGAPEPVDPLLAALALAWAARDVATYVDGGRPSTWSATVTVDPRLTRLETRRWLRHPACSCTWD
jgi:bacteriocin biosynthesis cyclodehydratase domain-containing protein